MWVVHREHATDVDMIPVACSAVLHFTVEC